MCVPWELNPQPFALLTQCSTTEPQEHTVCVVSNRKDLHGIYGNILWLRELDVLQIEKTPAN